MSRPIKHGTTDQSTVIRIVDSGDGTPEEAVEHTSAGIALWYRREAGLKVAITPAALAALDTAHTDGGIEHIDDGYYRLDLPDAACVSGAAGVAVGGVVTGMVVIGAYHPLVAYDPADAVRLGLTALPGAAADAAGGLPISDAGGLDLDAQKADVAAILVDTGTTLQGDIDGINARIPSVLAPSGNMKADTLYVGGMLQTAGDIPALVTTVDGVVDAILVDTAEIGAAGAGLTALPAALLDLANGVETGVTMRQALRALAAVMAGEASGGPTASAFKALSNAGTTRVTITADTNGDRSSVVLNL